MKIPKKYKDWIPCYTYRIHWSDVDHAFVVSVEELEGCMTHADTFEEAVRMGLDAVEGHIEALLSIKAEVPEPISKIKASGDFLVRSNPSLHQRLIQKQHQEGYKSLNSFIVEKLEKIAK